jgi:DNA invertase Pin-like site-specific DNA recombinase
MRKAYSYQRFSSIKQKEGDSTRRQTAAAEQFCRRHSLVLVDTFTDEGVSGFRGKNFTNESALSEFLKLLEHGSLERGSVLILENMDRLSRQSILPCMSKFIEIINRGVSVGVISQNRILDEKSITENPMELMLVLVEFARANNESETKSKRAKSVIAKKVELAMHGEKVWFAVQKPSWVVGLKNGSFVLDEERVKLVKDIFAHYLAGWSCSHIANWLNQNRTRTLRRLKHAMWTNATVAELLRNRNVLGWFGINGVEIDDYFPQIISDKVFRLVQQKLAFNVKNRGGSKYGLVRNLFKGLLTCEKCGQVIETKINTYRTVKGTVTHYADYICRGVKNKNGCKNKGRVSVADFEARMFQLILNLDDFSKPPPSNDALNGLENKLARTQNAIRRNMELLDNEELADMKQLAANLARLNKEQAQLAREIETEKAKAAAITNAPKALELLRDKFRSGFVTYVDSDSGELVKDEIVLMPNDPEKAIKLLKDELGKIKEHLKGTDQRRAIRNMMPTIFDGIRIRFGRHVIAFCKFVDGKESAAVIKSEDPNALPKDIFK